MSLINKKVSVPNFLHELHGKEAKVYDILLVYTAALLSTICLLYLVWDLPLKFYKFIVLGVLIADISGGVVSNFTKGTNDYYSESPKLRKVFISLHVVQPSLLVWIFPQDLSSIIIVSVYSLLTLIIVSSMRNTEKQRVLAVFFVLIGLLLTFVLIIHQPVVHIVLVLFLLKLTLAFAVDWK